MNASPQSATMHRRPLSILYLIENCGHGGAEAQIAMQASAVAALGHRALIAAPGSGWLAEEAQRRGLEWHALSRGGKLAPLRWIREIAGLVRSQRVDVLQAYLLQMNFCAAVAGALTGRPALASVRGRVYDFDKASRLFAYRVMARAGVTFTAPSRELRDELVRRAAMPPARAIAIQNGVDFARLRARAGAPAPGLPAGFRVGTVGRLDPVKGLDHLIAAAALVAPQAPDVCFVIAGDGPERAALEERARQLAVAERVTFLGQRDDVPAVLASLDLFVQSSLSEGLSNALLEAMALGCPIVATEIGPNAEAVRHLESALLVPPADAPALAEAILRLRRDRSLAADLGRAARARAEENFSLERSVERYLELYYALLERRRGVPAAAAEQP